MINNARGLGISDRRTVVVTMLAGGAIVAKQTVALDTSQTDADMAEYVVQAPTSSPYAVGIALEAATGAGESIRVALAGFVEDAVVDNVTAGDLLVLDAASAGTLQTYVNTDTNPQFAVALESHASAANVWLFGLGLGLAGSI